MSARPRPEREEQAARLEVGAADRVDDRQAFGSNLQHLDAQNLGVGDLAMALLEAEPAHAQLHAMAQER